MTHIPVLQEEVLKYLNPKPNENFIDGTFGEGGHTIAVLEKNGPDGKVLAIEIDPQLYQELKKRMAEIPNIKFYPKRLILVNDSYTNLKEIVKKYNFKEADGILFDLGMSSFHLEKSGRGFSFKRDEVLDMRYDRKLKIRTSRRSAPPCNCFTIKKNEKLKILTAEKILNNWSESEIERILKEYGEERFSKSIVKKIIEVREFRPIKTTFQLVEIIKKATPSWYHHKKIHFATKTFQALRIAVNQEIENLKKALPQTLEVLRKEGRLVVISFHSLEDRIVKNFLKENQKKGLLKILSKKPIMASDQELKKNPRARSARLRAAKRLGNPKIT